MIRKILLGVLLSVCVLIVFFLTFWSNLPGERIGYAIKNLAASNAKGVDLRLTQPETSLFGLGIRRINVFLSGQDQAALNLDDFKLNVINTKLLVGAVSYAAGLYNGNLNGTFSLPGRALKGSATNVNINRNPFVNSGGYFSSNPLLDFDYDYSMSNGALLLNFVVKGVEVGRDSPALARYAAFGMPESFALATVTGNIRHSPKNGAQIRIVFSGDFEGTLEGTLSPDPRNLMNSPLNLKLTGKFSQAFYEESKSLFTIIQSYVQQNSVNLILSGRLGNVSAKKI